MQQILEFGIKVGDIMNNDFVSVAPKTKILKCIEKMTEKRTDLLVVGKPGKSVGIVTEKEIIDSIAKRKEEENISNIAKKTASMKPDEDLYKAILKMKKKNLVAMPVVSKKKVLGFIKMHDIVKMQPAISEIALNKKEEKIVKEGICDECGMQDIVYKVGDNFLCSHCEKG